jgi:DNA repair ATPase RecN
MPHATRNKTEFVAAESQALLARTEALESLLLEYRHAVHEIANHLASAGLQLDLYEGESSDHQPEELVAAMRTTIDACAEAIQRLHAVRDGDVAQ